MDVSVVIPTRNRSALLAMTVRSVLRQQDVSSKSSSSPGAHHGPRQAPLCERDVDGVTFGSQEGTEGDQGR